MRLLSIVCFCTILSTTGLSQAPFITTWKTDNPGSSCNSCITITTNTGNGAVGFNYNFDVDWENDGVFDAFGITEDIVHDYGTPGIYQVAIRGVYPHFGYSGIGIKDKEKLVDVNQWGDIEWLSFQASFQSCDSLFSFSAIDSPDLSQVTTISGLFQSARNFSADLDNWDVSNIERMDGVFEAASMFNGKIESWNVSNVTIMDRMFQDTDQFDIDISMWNVSNVEKMSGMFENSKSFNQEIGNWDLNSCQSLFNMLNGASSFDKYLSNWDLQNVTNLGTRLLSGTSISIENYESTLITWSQNPNTPQNLELGAHNLQYCDETGRSALINNLGWTITGDSQATDEDCEIPTGSCTNPIALSSYNTNISCAEAEVLIEVTGNLDQAFEDDSNAFCGLPDNPTVWYALPIDGNAATLQVSVDAIGFDATWGVYDSCGGNVLPGGTTSDPIPCGEETLNGGIHSIGVDSTQTSIVYIAISATDLVLDGSYTLSYSTSLVCVSCSGATEFECGNGEYLLTADNDHDGLFETVIANDGSGQICPGVDVEICFNLTYDTSETGDDWLHGLVPTFGNGWDLSDTDLALQSIPEFVWYDENDEVCFPRVTEQMPNLCTYEGLDGELKLCNTKCQPCPCETGPALPANEPIPSGWFANTEACGDGDCPFEEYGLSGGTQYTFDFCITAKTRVFEIPDEYEENKDLSISFQTFSDGVTGCWNDPISECLVDPAALSPYYELADETTEECQDFIPFITIWKTDNPGKTCDSCIEIPTNNEDYTYNYDVDWENDGIWDEFGVTGDAFHDYGTPGLYEVAIRNRFPHLYFYNSFAEKDNSKIVNVIQWGDIEWLSMNSMFYDCKNITIFSSEDLPILTNLSNMASMFALAESFNGDINGWDVSNVTSTRSMFFRATNFNQDIGDWDVSNVVDMNSMFSNATNFNQNIGNWNVSKVTQMQGMFQTATNFNQDIGSWSVSNVINSNNMFESAINFNQDIGDWNVSNVRVMEEMFRQAINFNQDIRFWDVSNVENMNGMFLNATSFNHDIGGWDLRSIVALATNSYMLDSSGLSIENYEATLLGWSQNPNTPSNLELGAESLQYCDEAGRNALINNLGWNINGDSKASDEDCQENPDNCTEAILDLPTVCLGEDGTAEVINCSDYSMIQWTVTDTGCTYTIPGSELQLDSTFIITLTSIDGCEGFQNVTMTVNHIPELVVTGSLSFCAGSNTVLGLSETYSAYNWSNGDTNPTTAISSGGTITVMISDANGCTGSTSVNIQENSNLTIPDNTVTICDDGLSTATFDAGDANPNYTFAWDANAATSGTIAGGLFTTSVAGSYMVTVTDASSACTGQGAFTLSLDTPPTIDSFPSVLACDDPAGGVTTVDLTVYEGASTPGSWSDPNAVFDTFDETNLDFEGLAIGNYEFIYITFDVGECLGISQSLIIEVLDCGPIFDCPLLELNIGDPCDDDNDITENDVVQLDCTCAGTPIFDCIDLMVNIGDVCDDNNILTENDVIQSDCICAGEQIECVIDYTYDLSDCSFNGTPFDPSDDIYYVDIQPLGVGAEDWTTDLGVSGLGSTSTTLGPFLMMDGPLEFRLISNLDMDNCFIDVVISPPQPCALDCSEALQLQADAFSVSFEESFSLHVTSNDAFPNSTVIQLVSVAGFEGVLSDVNLDSLGILSGEVIQSFIDPIEVDYEVCFIDCDTCAIATVTLQNMDLEDFVFPDLITPNNDGQNDVLQFNNNSEIANSRLYIFNRWGATIFKEENYTNSWDATGYPGGIYYYVLELNGLEIKKTLTVMK